MGTGERRRMDRRRRRRTRLGAYADSSAGCVPPAHGRPRRECCRRGAGTRPAGLRRNAGDVAAVAARLSQPVRSDQPVRRPHPARDRPLGRTDRRPRSASRPVSRRQRRHRDHRGPARCPRSLPGWPDPSRRAIDAQSLARDTARLPLADGEPRDPPRNTVDAIVTGCLYAQAGAIERMFARIASSPNALCLLAGGNAARIAPLLAIPLRRIDNLVLHGLAVVAASPFSSTG
jgi:hypothetical protein